MYKQSRGPGRLLRARHYTCARARVWGGGGLYFRGFVLYIYIIDPLKIWKAQGAIDI